MKLMPTHNALSENQAHYLYMMSIEVIFGNEIEYSNSIFPIFTLIFSYSS